MQTFTGEVLTAMKPDCREQYRTAVSECKSRWAKRRVDAGVCDKAKAALSGCLDRRSPYFELLGIAPRDIKPSPSPEPEQERVRLPRKVKKIPSKRGGGTSKRGRK